MRYIAFDIISEKQKIILCKSEGLDGFLVRATDHWIGRDIFIQGNYDFDKYTHALEVLKRLSPAFESEVLIDVGANIGSICIPAVARGFAQRAVAIEPERGNARLLQANVTLNGLDDHIRIAQTAAGSVDDELLELTLSDYNFGDHRIQTNSSIDDDDMSSRQVELVLSQSLDTICGEEPSNNNTIVWMDVQGFEGFVLKGATRFLMQKVPLVLEFSPHLMDNAGSTDALFECLAHYQSFVDLANSGNVRPISELPALRTELGSGGRFTDILVI